MCLEGAATFAHPSLSEQRALTMERGKGRRKKPLGSLIFAWLFVSDCIVTARNIERYDTAYECEGKTLRIECDEGELIHLIRANYGRFSITICNEHGNTDWSVNCMSPKSFRVLYNKCNQQRNCSIVASTLQFGDPCPSTLKYLEAHYRCLSAATTTTTTSRPSPPWLITSQPSVRSTASLAVVDPPTSRSTTVSGARESSAISNLAPPIPSAPRTSSTPTGSSPDGEFVDGEDAGKDFGRKGQTLPSLPNPTSTAEPSSKFTPWKTSRRPPSVVGNSDLESGSYGGPTCPPRMARNLFWNATRANDVAVQSCPGGANGLARWKCAGNRESANWYRDAPDLSECRSLWLTSLENRVLEGDAILCVSSDLSQVTNNSRALYGGDMMITTKIIKGMAEKMARDARTYGDARQREVSIAELLQGVVRTGSNLLDEAQMASWRDLGHREQMRVATSLLIGLEENAFLLADALTRERAVVQEGKNILMEVRVLETRNIEKGVEVFPVEASRRRWTASNDRIELTKRALLENSDDGVVRLVFMAFDRLEEILQPATGNEDNDDDDDGDDDDDDDEDDESPSSLDSDEGEETPLGLRRSGGGSAPAARILNSKVISASLGKGRHIRLSEPVRIRFRHLTARNVTNPTCVFWDYIVSAWSEEGCRARDTNETHTVCECDHLTNFAVLMDVRAVELGTGHRVALQIITYVGCVVSVVCLALAILTFQLFRGLKSDRTTIHKNLCICLLIAELVFVCGIGRTDQRIVCGIIAGFLQFFFLCAFSWMFLEGFQLYVMLIEVFEAEKSRLRWYYLIAYGGPSLVVAVSCMIDPLSYGTDRHCWLRADNYFIFSFVGPVALVILANLVFLSMAIRVMRRHANATASASVKNKEHSRLAGAKAWLRGAIVLAFLLGLTWTFGLLYLNEETVSMAYIFTTLNSLQGLFIFLFHCMQNEKVRKEYRKFARRRTWLPRCLRCSKSVSGCSPGSSGASGAAVGANGGKDFASSDPSAPTTDGSELSSRAVSNYLVSGRGWSNAEGRAGATVTDESIAASDPHAVATLPHTRHAYFPSATDIPKSATATWGPVNKNLMWKNISFKSCSRDSGHGGSEREEDSPRARNPAATLGCGVGTRDRRALGANGPEPGEPCPGARGAASPHNHTYTEIRDGEARVCQQQQQQRRGGGRAMNRGRESSRGALAGLADDDPVYEEIERGGEAQASSDLSDEDGRRRSDMSRQSSRSYGDHRPLIPYSPANDRNPIHCVRTGDGDAFRFERPRYSPVRDRGLNACWEKLRRQPARYELGEIPNVVVGATANFASLQEQPPPPPPPPHLLHHQHHRDHTRTVAVLDGHTVVCHLQPQTDAYAGRSAPPPSYSEC